MSLVRRRQGGDGGRVHRVHHAGGDSADVGVALHEEVFQASVLLHQRDQGDEPGAERVEEGGGVRAFFYRCYPVVEGVEQQTLILPWLFVVVVYLFCARGALGELS